MQPPKRRPKIIMDIAAPGHGRTSIGSKPMSVGHRSLRVDPMMARKRRPITLRAMQHRETAAVKRPEPESDLQMGAAEAVEKTNQAPAEVVTVPDTPLPAPAHQAHHKSHKTTVEFDPAHHAAELEQGLGAISAPEFAPQPTTQKPKRSKRKIFFWFSCISLLGVIGAYVAADVGLYDPGFRLPVRIFSTEQTVKVTEIESTPTEESSETAKATQQENPIDPAKLAATETGTIDATKWLLYEAEAYNMRIPDGWKLREKEGAAGLYAESALEYIPATPAVVEAAVADNVGPQEIMSSFILDVVAVTDTASACAADASSSNAAGSYTFSTSAALQVNTVVMVGTVKPENRSYGEIAEGEVAYLYCIAGTNTEVRATYVMSLDQPDVRVYVEAMLKSLELEVQ